MRLFGRGRTEVEARSETPESRPDPKEALFEFLASRTDEELALEFANYDSDTLNRIAWIAGSAAAEPSEALRIGRLASLHQTVTSALERDPKWYAAFARELPPDHNPGVHKRDGFRDKNFKVEPRQAPSFLYIDHYLRRNKDTSLPQLERLIDVMPIEEDVGREAYVPAACFRPGVTVDDVITYTGRITDRARREHARVTAVKLLTAKDANVGFEQIGPLLESIERRPNRFEAKISAAKHFATNRSEPPERIAEFVMTLPEHPRIAAIDKVGERYVYHGLTEDEKSYSKAGAELLVRFIDSFPAAERPGIRQQLYVSLYESDENETGTAYHTSRRIYDQREFSTILRPRNELTELLARV